VARTCADGNEPPGSTKGREFRDLLSALLTSKKTTPRSELLLAKV
jgi:hypothetical protein